MIEVQHFTKKYGDKTVVKDITFTAKDDAITGFIGHNGATSWFMFDGNLLRLVLSLVASTAVIALTLLAVKLFYLSTALAMQSTGGRKSGKAPV